MEKFEVVEVWMPNIIPVPKIAERNINISASKTIVSRLQGVSN